MADLNKPNLKVEKIDIDTINKAANCMKVLQEGFTALANAANKGAKIINEHTALATEIFKDWKPKTLHQMTLDNKGDYLLDEVFNEIKINEAGGFCWGCDLINTHCEGARCDEQFEQFYIDCSRTARRNLIINAMGKEYFKNLSLRYKLKLLNF